MLHSNQRHSRAFDVSMFVSAGREPAFTGKKRDRASQCTSFEALAGALRQVVVSAAASLVPGVSNEVSLVGSSTAAAERHSRSGNLSAALQLKS